MSDNLATLKEDSMSDAATAFAVLEWLEAKSADYPGLTDAMPSIEAAFSVGLRSPTDFQKYSIYPISLNETLASGNKTLDNLPAGAALNIVESDDKFQPFKETVTKKGYFANEDKSSDLDSDSLEYAKRQAKLVRKFKEKSSKNWHSLSGVSNSNNSDSHSAAEDKKALGNTALQGKDYELAIQLYTEAIEMSPDGPTSHVYYSNRAAAYCHKSEYELAVADCQTCISLEPSFTRAYARMGLANFYLKRYEDSAAAYEKATELEPTNAEHAKALEKARKKVANPGGGVAARPPAPGGGGMPDLSALAGMMGGAGGAPGGGDMGGLGAMLQNPGLMSAAQEMMKNPSMMAKAQEMMKDPNAMAKAMAMMGGGGGMPGMPPGGGDAGGGAGGGDAGGFAGFS